jgi:hypothetical protein
MTTNKRGLSRNIPADVKREVRRNSKFGCVLCRQLICEYEHIDPTFAEASSHEADKICLLCPTHHTEVTNGLLSKEQVKNAYKHVQTDASIKPPFYAMQLAGQNLALVIGDSLFEYVPDQSSIINIDGKDLLHLRYERDPITGAVPRSNERSEDLLLYSVHGVNHLAIAARTKDEERQCASLRNFICLFLIAPIFDQRTKRLLGRACPRRSASVSIAPYAHDP